MLWNNGHPLETFSIHKGRSQSGIFPKYVLPICLSIKLHTIWNMTPIDIFKFVICNLLAHKSIPDSQNNHHKRFSPMDFSPEVHTFWYITIIGLNYP